VKLVLAAAVALVATTAPAQSVDPELAKVIASIKAVDDHSHVNSTVADDNEFDALPLDGLPPFDFPVRLRPENPELLSGYRVLYEYQYRDLSDAHVKELRAAMQRVRKEKGEGFPAWALDKLGIDVMVANRVAMGPGLAPPRFVWASYVDALMLPLATKGETARNQDYAALYPLEEKLLARYMKDLGVASLPATLDAYLSSVVTPTLERQKKAGCIATKFEAAYLRHLDFDDPDEAAAKAVYAKYAGGGEPSHAEYKNLRIAAEAGRLGMAVHIHSFEGAGGFYDARGSDPLLLVPALNDPALRSTKFVIVHGGGMFASHTASLFMRPNVWADFSVMDQIYTASTLAGILRGWLSQYPEKVLFGTDSFAIGPDAGWELSAWLATTTARKALGVALTGMMRDGEITRARAEDIARMVLRGNAAKLYKLALK
jgi:hypothetical protein